MAGSLLIKRMNRLNIQILVFSISMIASALFYPKALAIIGIIFYLFTYREVALLPKHPLWKDAAILATIVATGFIATVTIWGLCFVVPALYSCTANSMRGNIFSFFAFPLVPYLVFFIFISLPHYIKAIFKHK